jgi:hypothetical protein
MPDSLDLVYPISGISRDRTHSHREKGISSTSKSSIEAESMTKWEYCEFRCQTEKARFGGGIKKQGSIVYFKNDGSTTENLNQDFDVTQVIAHLGMQGFEMVQCIRGGLDIYTWEQYIFKRPVPEG